MFSASLISFLVLTIVVSATPRVKVTSFPASGRLDPTSFHASLEAEKARVQYLQNGKPTGNSVSKQTSLPVTNNVYNFMVNVTVGNPSTAYMLIVDTDSANTWLGASTPYRVTTNSRDTENTVLLRDPYHVTGEEFLDTFSLGNGLDIHHQSFCVALSMNDFPLFYPGFDGVLGLGPVGLSSGTLESGALVPTVMDNLYDQRKVSSKIFTLAFQPTSYLTGAEIGFGGVDDSKHTGDISYVDITTLYPSSNHWGFEQSITYGSSAKPIVSSSAGVVTASASVIHLSPDSFNKYKDYTSAVIDVNTSLLMITADNYAKLESLYFSIGGTSFEFTPNAQTFPRALNTAIGGLADNIYLVIFSTSSANPGMQFVLGTFWLQRFYVVLDAQRKRIGIANTPYTFDTSN